jgi:hypothetical protein
MKVAGPPTHGLWKSVAIAIFTECPYLVAAATERLEGLALHTSLQV